MGFGSLGKGLPPGATSEPGPSAGRAGLALGRDARSSTFLPQSHETAPTCVGRCRNASCKGPRMTEPHFKDDEEREISRGGKNTAIFTLGVAAVVIVGGVALAAGIRQYGSPPGRPRSTSGNNSAGRHKTP